MLPPLTGAQTSQAPPAGFEVASIKAADPSAPQRGRMGSLHLVTTPGRLSARNANLRELTGAAYAVEDYQVAGGPPWMVSIRFDVEAKSADNANRNQMLPMLRQLLADRFKLVLHRETRELAIYALTVAKNGPKFQTLKPNRESCWPACVDMPAPTNHWRERDLPSLAAYLTRLGADRPVIDKTGLKGEFALDLNMEKVFADAAQNGGPATSASMFEAAANAIQAELGLKLVATKAPIEILVIERAERPSEN